MSSIARGRVVFAARILAITFAAVTLASAQGPR